MTRIAALALVCPPLLVGCMLAPTDDGVVTSTTAPLPFTGYDLAPSSSVQVRAWDFAANAMADVGATVSSSTTATTYAGTPLYAWSANRTLAPRFWRPGPAGGSCANVAATTTHTDGHTYNAMTVESDWSACLNAHPTVDGFSRYCRSNHDPYASLFTVDWLPVTVSPALLDLAGVIASRQVSINLDNFQPEPYRFCSASNPGGCPAGLSGDPETYKFYNPDASFIRQSGETLTFPITPSRHDPMTIYIDDMRSSRVDFRVEGGKLVFGITFEATGPEIRMNCIRNAACAFVDGKTIDFTAPRAEMAFDLAVAGDRITYSSVSTTFTTGLVGDHEADEAAAGIAAAINDKLVNEASTRSSVSAALDAVVRGAASLDSYPVREVAISGGRISVLPGCPRD